MKRPTTFSDKVFQKLLRGGALTLAIKVTSGVVAFAMAAAMARALASEEYGKFAALLSAGLFLGQCASVGQPKLVQRFLGHYGAPSEAPKAAGLLWFGLWILLFASGLTAIATFVGAAFLAEQSRHWLVVGPLVVGFAMAEFNSHVLRSLGRIPAALLPLDIIWRGSVLLFGVGLAMTATQITAMSVMAIAGLWLCTLIGWQFWQMRKLVRATYGTARDLSEAPAWRHATWGLWGLNVLNVSFPNITVVVISFLLGYAEAGLFFAALRIVALLAMPLTAINLTAGPDIAKQYHESGPEAVQKICRSGILIILPVVLAATLVVLLFANFFLGLFGVEADGAYSALVILVLGFLINALSGVTGLLMQMTGHDRRLLAYSGLSNAVALVALFILVPLWGLNGAAICVMIASSGWNIAIVRWARRNLQIDPSVSVLFLGAPKPKTDMSQEDKDA